MTEKDNNIWEIITAVLDGSASEEENSKLNSWLEENDLNKKTYNLILNSVIRGKEDHSNLKLKVFSKIQSGMIKRKYQRRVQLWRYCTAASIAALMLISYFFVKGNLSSSETYVEAHCPYGNKSQVILNDSTIVYLNSGSTLIYPSRFKGDFRRVILKGEGYFDVKKDRKHPFVVEAGEVTIRVLGTRFNVKNYEDENTIETTLIEGAVGLSGKSGTNVNKIIELIPNQQAIYNKSTGVIEKIYIDAELSALWKDGKYYFEKEPLSSIVKKLERNFNVNIRITSESLNNRVFSGLIDKNKNIFQTLDIMKKYSRFSYVLSSDTILLQQNIQKTK